ncbi:AzlC family ABC transporter permease [Motilimonas cestriensis]|nr:AzlC family ABC transporter permease [Motilimonas cestriensis]
MATTNTLELHMLRRREFNAGAVATLPLILGAIPFGILFGTLAPASGLSIAATMAMSIIVFAGSAQFIALGLIAAGASPSIIIFTTLVVNLRHLLYATALVERVKHLPLPVRAIMAFGLTDETFAAVSRRYQGDNIKQAHWFYLGSMSAMYGNWVLCTVIGIALGSAIPNITDWGLDFAMSVTFIGMVVPYLNSKAMISAVLVAAGMSLQFAHLPNKVGLLIAALAGISVGYLVAKYFPLANATATANKGV